MRIFYAAGPGGLVETYARWKRGEDEPGVPDIAYTHQFFDVCRALDAEALVVSSCLEPARLQDGAFQLEHLPIPLDGRGGLAFHAGRLAYTAQLIERARRFRADVAIFSHGVHWFGLSALAAFGVKVVPSLHCALWSPYQKPSKAQQTLLFLARPLFARHAHAVLAHPGLCAEQAIALGSDPQKVFPFVPIYRSHRFGRPTPAQHAQGPFRVLYVGRIEEDKGVFDLLQIAARLAKRGSREIVFDVCGDGAALPALRAAAKAHGLGSSFKCHGWVSGRAYRAAFERSHVVAVPSRTSEGFNAVVAEAVLHGRPVVSSSVVPALGLIGAAGEVVPPCDVLAYERALVRLADDRELYELRRAACPLAATQFLERGHGWGAALMRALGAPAELPTASARQPVGVGGRVPATAQWQHPAA